MFCSVQEADYEIASYARQHDSMGILGQDSDFIIYNRFGKSDYVVKLGFSKCLFYDSKMTGIT